MEEYFEKNHDNDFFEKFFDTKYLPPKRANEKILLEILKPRLFHYLKMKSIYILIKQIFQIRKV